jgi:GDP-L-fucose synthase
MSTSLVMPALIRKANEAKAAEAPSITLWGTGTPRREFLHVDDCAEALIFLMRRYSGYEHVNVGSGSDLTILELAETICTIVGYRGSIELDPSKPDGTPRKLMDSSRIAAMGWSPKIELEAGIRSTYQFFLNCLASDEGGFMSRRLSTKNG